MLLSLFRAYLSLTKPGIIFGNLVCCIGGIALASRGTFNVGVFGWTLLGLMCVIASACVFNNVIDRELDEKMKRTRNRVLVRGIVQTKEALWYGLFLGVLGIGILSFATNWVTASVALFGFAIYVGAYSTSKYYSVHGTLIGSLAGATPPVIGYCALSGQIDLAALLLFGMLAFWQMPHFYAIAIVRMEDYAAGNIPVLPLVRGMLATKVQMLLYVVGFIVTTAFLTQFIGMPFLALTLIFGLMWLALAVQGFWAANERKWARQMFLFSISVITILSLSIPVLIP